MPENLEKLVTDLAVRARAASLELAISTTGRRNAALLDLASRIDASHEILSNANGKDLASAQANGLTGAEIDRLTLTPARLRHLADSVRQVAALPDPVGEVLEETTRPNGLTLKKVRVPIGVVGVIFEARPNVAVDCAVLCLKSGNASILRGGKEIFETNSAVALLVGESLASAGLPRSSTSTSIASSRAAARG
jgi:glutamate-5-semialdehyde dehydrogenase